jgi:hypothetical protein
MERLTKKKIYLIITKVLYMHNFISLIYERDPVNERPLPNQSNGQINWNSFLQGCDNGVRQLNSQTF